MVLPWHRGDFLAYTMAWHHKQGQNKFAWRQARFLHQAA
jgi:hypothetical protein